jgi:lipopolysaccharide/colanic/teichoic acid biosynthesis glycosyltransferase
MMQQPQATELQLGAVLDDSYSFLGTGYQTVHAVDVSRENDLLAAEMLRNRILKRVIDVSLVLLALPLVLPVFAAIALLIRLDSPGPIFFSHRRIRRDGIFFSIWKFRTMCVNSSEVLEQHLALDSNARAEWHGTHKLREDPRVTRLGLLLRRYSIDELPQLWNVLTGKMSLVGPRPIVAAEVEKYGECFHCFCRVKPGLTGLWQVSGRSLLSYEERVALDCEYVRNWSPLLDVKILFRTIFSVANQDGAF